MQDKQPYFVFGILFLIFLGAGFLIAYESKKDRCLHAAEFNLQLKECE